MRALALSFALLAAGPDCGPQAAPVLRVKPRATSIAARAWPEADLLFRRDPGWLGGDAAVTIPLDNERVLWLFGDSFIPRPEATTRGSAVLVRNSIAVQCGADPSRAELRFYTGQTPDATPASFFPEEQASWFWPGHGLYLERTLTVFLERMRPDPESGGLGFGVSGWTAVRVRNAEAEPDAWQVERLATPQTGQLKLVGAAVVLEGSHVYAYAVREPGDHAVMLMRWGRDAFVRGELLSPEYWSGEPRGWTGGSPAVVIEHGATELSVSRVGRAGYVEVQSRGFGAAPIALRLAPALIGPWSAPLDVYRPPEGKQRGVLLYAARAHPELVGAGLVVTYASNSLEPKRLLEDLSLYFPRFVRVELP